MMNLMIVAVWTLDGVEGQFVLARRLSFDPLRTADLQYYSSIATPRHPPVMD